MSRRTFLFLQGPHGPFFHQLAHALGATGAKTIRVGFNGGDHLFWRRREDYIAFTEPEALWPSRLQDIIAAHNVTDLVFYGQGRSRHDEAFKIAKRHGLRTHIFEEGYLRPYWITYERDGTNGHSPLCRIPLSAMRSVSEAGDAPKSAAGWGELREHIFYGAVYHAALMLGWPLYRSFEGHRETSVLREAALNIGRFFAIPSHALSRRMATRRLRSGGYPYHLVLLQLEHDASFRGFAPFKDMGAFAKQVISAFAEGAPKHHHLVFKAHPLEDGRSKIRQQVRTIAEQSEIADRVHFLRGGKLAELLDDTRTAVTINSTAGQQVLRRGIPLKALGEAVYSGRGFTSPQDLKEFFANPMGPDREQYAIFRQFQLETSQVVGGYYSSIGRSKVLRRVVDMMVAESGPYARLERSNAKKQHLRIVAGEN